MNSHPINIKRVSNDCWSITRIDADLSDSTGPGGISANGDGSCSPSIITGNAESIHFTIISPTIVCVSYPKNIGSSRTPSRKFVPVCDQITTCSSHVHVIRS